MSGGHFDYQQFRMEEVAEDLDNIIANFSDTYSSETLAKFKEASEHIRKASRMLHRVDWLHCGDDGEESFHKHWVEDGL
jgi:hypothetical protein